MITYHDEIPEVTCGACGHVGKPSWAEIDHHDQDGTEHVTTRPVCRECDELFDGATELKLALAYELYCRESYDD